MRERERSGGRKAPLWSAEGSFLRPQRKTAVRSCPLRMRPTKQNFLPTWEHFILLRNLSKSIAFKITTPCLL